MSVRLVSAALALLLRGCREPCIAAAETSVGCGCAVAGRAARYASTIPVPHLQTSPHLHEQALTSSGASRVRLGSRVWGSLKEHCCMAPYRSSSGSASALSSVKPFQPSIPGGASASVSALGHVAGSWRTMRRRACRMRHTTSRMWAASARGSRRGGWQRCLGGDILLPMGEAASLPAHDSAPGSADPCLGLADLTLEARPRCRQRVTGRLAPWAPDPRRSALGLSWRGRSPTHDGSGACEAEP